MSPAFLLRLLPLALVGGVLLAPTTASAAAYCSAPDTYTVANAHIPVNEGAELSVDSVRMRAAGGGWQDASNDVCIGLRDVSIDVNDGLTFRSASVGVLLRSGSAALPDLSGKFPAGTRFSIKMSTTGAKPLMAVGTFDHGRGAVDMDTNTMVLQGDLVPVKLGPGDCPDDQTQSFGAYLNAGVMLDPNGTGPQADKILAYRGAFFGANGNSIAIPQVNTGQAGDQLFTSVGGCGDHQPETKEGFFRGFLPKAAAGALGINDTVLDRVPAGAFDAMMQLNVDDQPVIGSIWSPATAGDVAVEADGGPVAAGAGGSDRVGIAIDYDLSYSSHSLTARSVPSAVNKAYSCILSGGTVTASNANLGCAMPATRTTSTATTTNTTTTTPTTPARKTPSGRILASAGGVDLLSPVDSNGIPLPPMDMNREQLINWLMGMLHSDTGARVVTTVTVAPDSPAGRRRGRALAATKRHTKRRHVTVLGRATVLLRPGQTKPLKIKVSRAVARSLHLASRPSIKVTVRMVVTPTGGKPVATTKTFRVKIKHAKRSPAKHTGTHH